MAVPPLEQAYPKVVTFLQKVRAQGRTNALEWKDYEQELAFLPPVLQRAVSVWSMENLEHHQAERVRPRVLHETESLGLDVAAHGVLLEALRSGMISPGQGESILEEFLDFEQVHVHAALMREAVARTWAHNIRNYQKIQLN